MLMLDISLTYGIRARCKERNHEMIETAFFLMNSDLNRGYASREHNLERYMKLEFKEGTMTPSILRNGIKDSAKNASSKACFIIWSKHSQH